MNNAFIIKEINHGHVKSADGPRNYCGTHPVELNIQNLRLTRIHNPAFNPIKPYITPLSMSILGFFARKSLLQK